MEWGCPITLAGITYNHTGVSHYYWLDPERCDGIAGAGAAGTPIRTTVWDRPLADGAGQGTSFKAARVVTIGGLIVSPSGESNRLTMIDNLAAALETIVNADGVLSFTPTGHSARSLTVRHDNFLRVSGGWQKQFLFGLIAKDPTIT